MKRKNMKKVMATALVAAMMMSVVGCGKKSDEKYTNGDHNYPTSNEITVEAVVETDGYVNEYTDIACGSEEDSFYYNENGEPYNTNEYNDYEENSWQSVANSPLSTFAADVDTASYSQIRNCIQNGSEVDPGMVRIEEMINYFHYDYEKPKGDDKFGVCTEYMNCPWNPDTKLALVSLSTEAIDFSEAPASNLVFLVDTSGSMFDSNKLPLAQQSLCMVAENLTEKDRVSIVTYAGDDMVILEGATGDDYYAICEAVETMEANGSTNGSAGINTAYEIAEKYFIEGGNNRVILMTDGDLNVGVTSESSLEKLITKKKKSGVFLSVMGFGNGNYKDNKMETLADKGNGNYAYIDSIYEAKKALVDDMGANFVTVAKDVKLQVEFNPAQVKGYRLIGYENRVMAAEDFSDDTKDGGEMGAGHTVTALYEIALVDSDFEINETDLKYDHSNQQENVSRSNGLVSKANVESDDKAEDEDEAEDEAEDETENETEDETEDEVDDEAEKQSYGDEIFTVSVRYKEIDSDKSTLDSFVCTVDDYSKKGSDNLRFAAAVAAFGMYLKDSRYMGDVDKEMIIDLAVSTKGYKTDEYKKEFVELVEMAQEPMNYEDDWDYEDDEYGDYYE